MDIRPIPGRDNYFATADGEIYSLQRSGELYLLKARTQNSGYLYVRHPRGWTTIHRLVCLAFHGLPPGGRYECRHLNGKKRDNRAVNLCWGTKNQNFSDKLQHGKTRLTPDRVRRIRMRLMEGAGMSELANVFNVSYHTIYYIAQGMTWRKKTCGLTEEFREWQKVALTHQN